MAAETFFARWSRRKAEAREVPQTDQPQDDRSHLAPPEPRAPGSLPPLPDPAPAPASASAPTLADVALLTPESDFQPFLARGVDEGVRRAALKKLFADPHFNVMDGLDTYIDDYNKFEPLSPLMAAALNHAKELVAQQFVAEPDKADEPKDQDL